VLAGHSYGGQIITALGSDAPNVVGLVFIAAFGLDEGESLGALLGGGPPTPALAHLIVDDQGLGWLPEEDFVDHFASGVDPVEARVMYAVQQPLCMTTFDDVMRVPARRSLRSWYLGRGERRGHPARRGAPVRPAHGRGDGRGARRRRSRRCRCGPPGSTMTCGTAPLIARQPRADGVRPHHVDARWLTRRPNGEASR
jgi:pimeloyl-ACP methyl ester carboxylesterase